MTGALVVEVFVYSLAAQMPFITLFLAASIMGAWWSLKVRELVAHIPYRNERFKKLMPLEQGFWLLMSFFSLGIGLYFSNYFLGQAFADSLDALYLYLLR